MKMGLPPVNYSTWQHILCSKVEIEEDVKNKKSGVIVCSRLHSGPSSFLPSCNSAGYLCIKLPLLPPTHQKEIKIKSKNKAIQSAAEPGDDKRRTGKTKWENYIKVGRISLCF